MCDDVFLSTNFAFLYLFSFAVGPEGSICTHLESSRVFLEYMWN